MAKKLPHEVTERDVVEALIEAHEYIGSESVEASDIHALHGSGITAVIYVATEKLRGFGAIVEPEPEGHAIRLKQTYVSAGTRVSAFCEDLPMNGRICVNGGPCHGMDLGVCVAEG